MRKIDRTGEIGYNNQGLKMKIIKYNNSKNITVKFEDGYISKNREYKEFKGGGIKNPYFPEIYNIGYIGEGKYKARENDKKMTREYETWISMLKRCYDEKVQKKRPSYIGCTICDEWLNFQNFAEWFDKNYYDINSERMCLDKDILIKGNKIYSPETCVFTPIRINSLFVNNKKSRGKFLIGVSKVSNPNNPKQYQAKLPINNKNKCFKTEIEAFNWYKEEKEKLIKKVADEYKDKIPEKLYEAMINWNIDIND